MAGKRKQRHQQARDPLEALEAQWNERGPAALETIREYDPGAFLQLMVALVADYDD